MQLRCFYCQTMFTLSRETMLAALQQMQSEKLHHFDAHCPKCRRANRIVRERLERAYPNWQQALKEIVKQVAKVEKEQATEAIKEEPATPKQTVKEIKSQPPAAKKPAVAKPAPKAEKKPAEAKRARPITAKKLGTSKKATAASTKKEPTKAKKPSSAAMKK